jgi:hypothetical protein
MNKLRALVPAVVVMVSLLGLLSGAVGAEAPAMPPSASRAGAEAVSALSGPLSEAELFAAVPTLTQSVAAGAQPCSYDLSVRFAAPAGAAPKRLRVLVLFHTANDLSLVREAVGGLLDALSASFHAADHRVALISYDRVATVRYGWGNDYAAARAAMEGINPLGPVCTECGLLKAQEMLPPDAGRTTLVVVLGDAAPNLKNPAGQDDFCGPPNSPERNCPTARTVCVTRALDAAATVRAASEGLYAYTFGEGALGDRCGDATLSLLRGIHAEMDSEGQSRTLSAASLREMFEARYGQFDLGINPVTLRVAVAPGWEIVPPAAPATVSGNVVSWAYARLEPGESRTVRLSLRALVATTGTVPLATSTATTYRDRFGQEHTLTVTPQPEVTIPALALAQPQDVVVNAGRGCVTPVSWEAPAILGGTAPVNLVSTPASGSLFAVGTTEVVVRATDACGKTAETRFRVIVVAPEIEIEIAPIADKVIPAEGRSALFVHYGPFHVTGGTPDVAVSVTPPSGTRFTLGTHIITVSASDPCGRSSTRTFQVRIVGEPTVVREAWSDTSAMLYRLSPTSRYRPYRGNIAALNDLIVAPEPPAPRGWNQPGFAPDGSWRQARLLPIEPVWVTFFRPRPENPPLPTGRIIGIRSEGRTEAVDGMTHLIRQTITLTPPGAYYRLASAQLVMWSDNKSAWWWEGRRLPVQGEGYVGSIELMPHLVGQQGGRYLLAVQTSNDYQSVGGNPHGTAYVVRATWVSTDPTLPARASLPVVLK